MNSEKIELEEYRFLVGNTEFFDYASAIQFNLLTTLGLREDHFLLDIGCGALRAGRLFIPYLRPERYYGLEPHEWLVREGISRELGQSAIDIKRPRFLHDTEFTLTGFGCEFDFLLAQSIFSHASQQQMRRCFAEAARVMKPTSIFAATYFEGNDDYGGDQWAVAAEYTPACMQRLVEEAGLEYRSLEWPHQDGQKWFLILHPDHKLVIPAAHDTARIIQLEDQLKRTNQQLLALRNRWLVRTARKIRFAAAAETPKPVSAKFSLAVFKGSLGISQAELEIPSEKSLTCPVAKSPLNENCKMTNHSLIEVRLGNGKRVSCLRRSEADLVRDQVREYFRHGISVKAGDTVFDVGANIGMFSMTVDEMCGGNVRVFAFEPIPATFSALKANVESHCGPQVTPICCGLSAEVGEIEFAFYPRLTMLSSAYHSHEEEEEVRQQIKTGLLKNLSEAPRTISWIKWLPVPLQEWTLDLLTRHSFRNRECYRCPLSTVSEMMRRHNVSCIDLLKVDVEKSELDVLHGIDEADWPKVRQLVMEVHDIDQRVERIRKLLTQHAFPHVTIEQETMLRGSNVFSVYARRDANTGP